MPSDLSPIDGQPGLHAASDALSACVRAYVHTYSITFFSLLSRIFKHLICSSFVFIYTWLFIQAAGESRKVSMRRSRTLNTFTNSTYMFKIVI